MAYTSIKKLIDDIKQEVGRDAHKIARGVAQVAYTEMQDAHKAIMDSFYAGYTPVESYTYYAYKDGIFYSGRSHGYRRTYNLRENSIIPQGVIPSGKHSFKAQISIGSQNMNDYINVTNHVFPASAVFDLIWNQGIRGLPPGNRGYVGEVNISANVAGIYMSGTPDQAMNDFMEQWIVERASDVADIIASGI